MNSLWQPLKFCIYGLYMPKGTLSRATWLKMTLTLKCASSVELTQWSRAQWHWPTQCSWLVQHVWEVKAYNITQSRSPLPNKGCIIAYITTTKIDKGELYKCSIFIDTSHVNIRKHAILKGYVLIPFVGWVSASFLQSTGSSLHRA